MKDISHTNAAGDTSIAVKSSKYSVIFQLNDSQAAKELYDQLPLTLKVENYSDNEKIFYPPKELRTNSTPKSRGSKGSWFFLNIWYPFPADEPAFLSVIQFGCTQIVMLNW